jgi:hypothetical protein
MAAWRHSFDVDALMKARKESKQLHKEIVKGNESVKEKMACLQNLQMKEKQLDLIVLNL